MMFQSKLDRAMGWIKSKNKGTHSDEIDNENKEDYKLKKMDILAIIISGFLVFAPLFIVLIIILYFVLQIN